MPSLMRITSALIAALTLVLALAVPVPADTVTFRDGLTNAFATNYNGTQDAYLSGFSTFSDDNTGAATTMDVSGSAGNPKWVVLAFDLSSMVASNAAVSGATLRLYVTTTTDVAPADTPFNVDVFQIFGANAGWAQGTGLALSGTITTAGTGDVTWAKRSSPSGAWKDAAGADVTNLTGAIGATAAASALFSESMVNGWLDFSLPASLVQTWITTPATNAGLVIKVPASQLDTVRFASSENATAANRPTLEIQYVVPEPASLALLTLGGLACAIRTRRVW